MIFKYNNIEVLNYISFINKFISFINKFISLLNEK